MAQSHFTSQAVLAAIRIGALDILADAHDGDSVAVSMTVDEIMTRNLIVATEDDEIDYIQAVMTENRVRHIPILAGHELKGMISIGDVVKSQLKEKDVENKYLKDYMADK